MMVVIFVFEQGMYSQQTVEMVTENIEQVASEYVKVSKQPKYIEQYHYPSIQVWKNGSYVSTLRGLMTDKKHIINSLNSTLNR